MSQSLTLFLGILRLVFKIPYLQLEGFARKHKNLVSIPSSGYGKLPFLIVHVALDKKRKQVLSVEVSDGRTKDGEQAFAFGEKGKRGRQR